MTNANVVDLYTVLSYVSLLVGLDYKCGIIAVFMSRLLTGRRRYDERGIRDSPCFPKTPSTSEQIKKMAALPSDDSSIRVIHMQFVGVDHECVFAVTRDKHAVSVQSFVPKVSIAYLIEMSHAQFQQAVCTLAHDNKSTYDQRLLALRRLSGLPDVKPSRSDVRIGIKAYSSVIKNPFESFRKLSDALSWALYGSV